MASQTFSGARAIFMINAVPVAFAGGVSLGEEINYEPVDVLNLLEVREHVPVAYTCTLSATMFRVVGQSLKRLGILPRQEEIIMSGDLEAAIQDVVTRQTVSLVQGVRCSGHTWDITARGLVSEAVSFVCVRILDEAENPA